MLRCLVAVHAKAIGMRIGKPVRDAALWLWWLENEPKMGHPCRVGNLHQQMLIKRSVSRHGSIVQER